MAKTTEDKPEPKAEAKAASFDEKAIKAWVRAELHLAANGVSEVEREKMNP